MFIQQRINVALSFKELFNSLDKIRNDRYLLIYQQEFPNYPK